MTERSFILYCDESAKKGKHFSNFYGGSLIDARHKEAIETALQAKCNELNLFGELKWTKVTENYFSKYVAFLDVYFAFIGSGHIKTRLMFTQNVHRATNLTDYHEENRYFLLYYQFIKHAFGLQYADLNLGERLRLVTLLDELPEKKDRSRDFKGYLNSLERFPPFRRRGWTIAETDIADVDSKDRLILQGLDIILGSIQFRLNDGHREKPQGSNRRGKRTVAKEKLYRHINRKIREIYPNFNIGVSTGRANGPSDKWNHAYRHWLFVPSEREYLEEFAKKDDPATSYINLPSGTKAFGRSRVEREYRASSS